MRIPTTTTELRQNNKHLVTRELKKKRTTTKGDICRAVHLSFATVSNICSELEKEGFVSMEETSGSTGGRKPLKLVFNPQVKFILALDLSGMAFAHVGLLDLNYELIYEKKISLMGLSGLDSLLSTITICYREMINEKGISDCKILGAGVSIPAEVDERREIVINSNNKLFSNVNLEDRLEKALGLPVNIGNDAKIAALGQSFIFGEKIRNLLFLYFTRGIGLGIVIDGKVYKGNYGFAGVISHLEVTDEDIECECGNSGCFEAVVSLSGILRIFNKNKYSLEEIIANQDEFLENFLVGCKNKERDVLKVLDFVGTIIGKTVASLVDIFNPQVVAIGGNIRPFCDYLIPIIQHQVKKRSFAANNMDVEIMFAESRNSFMFKGCGEMVFQQWEHSLR